MTFDPTMWLWLAVAMIPAAALSGYRLWGYEERDRIRHNRLEAFRGALHIDAQPDSAWQKFGKRFAPIIGIVDQQRLLKALRAAGYTGRSSLNNFIAIKATSALSFGGLTWLVLEWRQLFSVLVIGLGAIGIALIIGWRLPDWVLNHLVKRRRMRIEHGIPDALDLLVVCAESGLSLNQAVEEISRQLRVSTKDVADEFAATSAEMRIADFGQALDNLVERTGLENLRGLVATLKQSLRFGTSLAESLRIIASEMRAERNARMEERAARLPVLLAIPMMAFILPCLLMIIGTPVVLRIMEAFRNIHFGGMGVH
jgi:tight adherence protein C